MIRVRAPSRLHFGLFSLAAGTPRPNIDGELVLPPRRFGGVGLMIEEPGLTLTAEPAKEWAATGPSAERVAEFARRLSKSKCQPMQITIESAPPQHVGLGTGTQLALAVAKAVAIASGQSDWPAEKLAEMVGRGLRSAIGIHGFDRGGLIVEAGKLADEPVSPLVAHESIPDHWRIVLITAGTEPAIHGGTEKAAFEKLEPDPAWTDSLCRLVLLDMLPALRAGDCRGFGEAVYEFNACVGEAFAPVQGGRYCSSLVAEAVKHLRALGVKGVGQSSWGPTVFAIVEDDSRAENIRELLRRRYGSNVGSWISKASRGHETSR